MRGRNRRRGLTLEVASRVEVKGWRVWCRTRCATGGSTGGSQAIGNRGRPTHRNIHLRYDGREVAEYNRHASRKWSAQANGFMKNEDAAKAGPPEK